MKLSPAFLFISVGGLAVIVAVVAGLIVIGTPGEVRIHRLDQQRVSDLQGLSNAINGYRRTRNRLPDSLEAMQRSGQAVYWHTEDAETKAPYEYRIKDETSYELCAQFDAASGNDEPVDFPGYRPSPFWKHGAGRQCFTFGVDQSNRQLLAP